MESLSAISFGNFSYPLCARSGPWCKRHLLVRYHLPEAPKLNARPLHLGPYNSLSNQVFSDTFQSVTVQWLLVSIGGFRLNCSLWHQKVTIGRNLPPPPS